MDATNARKAVPLWLAVLALSTSAIGAMGWVCGIVILIWDRELGTSIAAIAGGVALFGHFLSYTVPSPFHSSPQRDVG